LCRKTDLGIRFAQIKDFQSDVERQRELATWFPDTPAAFWSETCVKHNGFFGSHTSTKDTVPSPKSSLASSSTTQAGTSSSSSTAADHHEAISTYFRLIVKILKTSERQNQTSSNVPSATEYGWHEMGFISFSSDSRSSIICFDVPEVMIKGLQDTPYVNSEQLRCPFGLHIPLLEELVKLYDRSIWDMARKVREVEKVSQYQPSRSIELGFFALATTDKRNSSNESEVLR
jgi:hypothetical protein